MAKNTTRKRGPAQSERQTAGYGDNRFEGRFQSLYEGGRSAGRVEEYSRRGRGTSKPSRSSRFGSGAGRSNGQRRGAGNTARRERYPEPRVSREYREYDRRGDGFFEGGRDYYESYERQDRERRERRNARGQSQRNAAVSLGKRTGYLLKKANGDPEKQKNFVLPDRTGMNFTLLACVILLLVVGLIMVTSSSYYYAYSSYDDSMYFFRRQVIWSLIGIVAMLIISRVPLTWIRGMAFPIYLFSVFCSVLVLFIGTSANGSTRWLGVGSLSFQPAELAKLAVAIYISKLVEDNQKTIGTLKTFGTILFVLMVPTALVAYQNLSSGIIIAGVGVIIMFVGGAKIKHFMGIIIPLFALAALVVVLPLLIDTSEMGGPLGNFLREFAYRSDRVSSWLDPFSDSMGDGYQTVQALYAVGSGGFFGRGLGQSIQKLGFIPFAYNDIIFAVICEELGLFGAIVVVFLFGVFTWNGVKISLSCPNLYTSLLSIGLVGQIAVQAVLNIAVNTNSMPATGVSLPFISYGGSSMLFLMASVGLILNISTFSKNQQKEEVSAAGKEAT